MSKENVFVDGSVSSDLNALSDYERQALKEDVAQAYREDVGSGDITARLISEDAIATAVVISRESAVVCGQPWAKAFADKVDSSVVCEWHCNEGELLAENAKLLTLRGVARSLLTIERGMLNFLQTFMGTATLCRSYANKVSHTGVKLLDTRKTIPGLRAGQKYAVRVGGCHNHRIGLFDAFLIKENHIKACGSIESAVAKARGMEPDKPIEVEVENIEEYILAEKAGADIIMLDNFDLNEIKKTVRLNQEKNKGSVKLEASGGITEENLVAIASTGVDYISLGGLTKHLSSIDLSMRFV